MKLNEKITSIKNNGYENLQIVLDFDRTITGPVNGEPAPPMISFLRQSDILGEEYKREAQSNFEYYYKFEKSSEMSHEEKSQLMHEWWNKHLNQLVKFGLTKDKILKIVNSENLILREGVRELLSFCDNKNIPIIIFSAGILGSESIRLFFEKFKIDFTNFMIITNELVFDDSGKVVNFKEPIIHSENKDEETLILEAKMNNWILRKNSILAGDGIGDIKMAMESDSRKVYRLGILDRKSSLSDEEFENERNIYLKYFDDVSDNFNDILSLLK